MHLPDAFWFSSSFNSQNFDIFSLVLVSETKAKMGELKGVLVLVLIN